jgi:ribosomal protein L34E
MEIIRYQLPLDWNEKTFDSYNCYNCGKNLKILGVRALKTGKKTYVYEIKFPNRFRIFLCEDCFKKLVVEAIKIML